MNRKAVLIVSAVLFSAILFILSPFFHFAEITLVGNTQIEKEEILKRAGLNEPTNFFMFNPGQARRNVMENPYIDQIVFSRVFPNILEITVQERFLSGFVEFLDGMFLYIDENGRVLEVRSYMSKELPIITGLRFSHFHLGQILEVDNPEAFNTVVTYAQLLNRHNLAGIISVMDVADPNNTRIRLHNIEVYLGDTRNAHEKILTLREIVDVWQVIEYAPGFLDLREPGSEYIFRKLT